MLVENFERTQNAFYYHVCHRSLCVISYDGERKRALFGPPWEEFWTKKTWKRTLSIDSRYDQLLAIKLWSYYNTGMSD